MRKTIRSKRERGYGACVELPAPVYWQGAIMGLLDPIHELIHYVLLCDQENTGCNYVRCKRWRPVERLYVPGPLKIWNPAEEKKELIPEARVQSVAHFARGMMLQSACEVTMAGRSAAPDRMQQGQLYLHYIAALGHRIEKTRNWNMLLGHYVLHQVNEPSRQWMRPAALSGVFDLMIEAHERMFTVLDVVGGEEEE